MMAADHEVIAIAPDVLAANRNTLEAAGTRYVCQVRGCEEEPTHLHHKSLMGDADRTHTRNRVLCRRHAADAAQAFGVEIREGR